MRTLLVLAAACALCACPHRPSAATAPAPPPAPAPVPERWVDASALPGGDGSPQRPFKRLGDALQKGRGVIHLATGLYEGPFALEEGTTLVGQRAAVLHADRGQTVVTARGGELRNLILQGGDTGLVVEGEVTATALQWSGQARTAVSVRSGALQAHALRIDGTISDTVGLEVKGGARLTADGLQFTGGLKEGLFITEGAEAKVTGLRSEGPATAVRTDGATLELSDSTSSGGRAAALFLGAGKTTLKDVTVFGHEYGLLAGSGAQLTARGFTSVRAQRAGVATVSAKAELIDLVVADSGSYGGVQSSNTALTLRAFVISGCQKYGITVIEGTADLQNGVIVRVIDPEGVVGDGLHLRRARVRAESVSVRRVDGAGVLAAEGSQVALRDLFVERARWGGVLAESGARVEAASLYVRDTEGAALVVPDNATLRADLLLSADNAQGDVWAECGQGAQVFLSRLRSKSGTPIASPCIARWTNPRLFDPFEP